MASGQAAYSNQAMQPAEIQTPVAQQVRRILDGLNSVRDTADNLTANLDQVLLPEPPTTEGNSGIHPVPNGCPLQHQLREIADRVEALGSNLQRLRSRIEV